MINATTSRLILGKPCHAKSISSRHIKIIHYNIEGYYSEAHGNKLLDDDFLTAIKGYDLIALTETHAGNNNTLEIPGYVMKSIVRPKSSKAKKYSGGIALAIRENIAGSVRILESKSDSILWAKINREGAKDFLLGIIYITPINSSYTKNILDNANETWDILEEEISRYKPLYNVSLLGDFNSRTAKLPDYIVNDDNKYLDLPLDYTVDSVNTNRNNTDVITNTYGKTLLELCKVSGLRIVNGRKIGDSNGKKTCHQWNGSSTVDYMLADTEIFPYIQSFQVQNLIYHLSDHCPIATIINMNVNSKNITRTNRCISSPKNIKWNGLTEKIFTSKLTDIKVKSELENLSKIKIDSVDTIEMSVKELSKILKESANIRSLKSIVKIKSKSKKRKNQPWFTDELFRMKKYFKKAGEAFMTNDKDPAIRESFFKIKKEYKKRVTAKKKQFRQLLYNRLEEMNEKNPKEYWELFDKLRKNKHTADNVCPINDQEWIKHYLKLLGPRKYNDTRLKQIRDEIDKLSETSYFSQLDFSISKDEIEKAIRKLKKGKAVGIDQINNEMIKSASAYILDSLQNIFNAILCNQYYPDDWKLGIITNLYKSGDKLNTNNYRGLTINSSIAKVFNIVMNDRLLKYLEEGDIISKTQIGFKKKARTSDHIFVINTIFRKFCNGNKNVFLCFIDFQKAYDSVWQEALMLKLLRIGVKGNFFGVIRNMYTGCKSCIKSEGALSDFF